MKKTLLLNYLKAASSRNPRKNSTRFNGLLTLFVMVMGMGVSWGQTNYYWNCGSVIPTTGSNSNITSVEFNTSAGNNNGTTTLISTTSPSTGYSGSSGTSNFGAACKTGSIVTNSSTYFSIIITPSSNYRVKINSISFGSRGTSTGPQNVYIYSSIDNFTTSIGNVSVTNNSTWVLKNISFEGTNLNRVVTGPVTIRIYGADGSGSPSVNTANWRIDDVNLSVTDYPVTTWNGSAWSNGTPTSTVDAIINGNYTEAVNISCKDLTINSGNTLTIGAANSLTVAGNLVIDGNLIFKSDSNGTARFASYSGAAITSSNVTVERYIPAKRAWRALTAPLKGSTNNSIYYNWQNNGNLIANTGVEIWSNLSSLTNVTSGGTGSSLLTYNSVGNSWSGVTNTSTTNLFSSTINNPFMVFVTGPFATSSTNITTGTAATTLRATGSLITGTQTYATTGTQYTLIGNPYASSLSLTAMLSDTDNSTNFNNGIWIWDSNGNATVGSYNYFDKNASAYSYTNSTTPASNPISASAEIQSGQAFFVQSTTGNGASFSIKEAHKGTSVINTVLRDAAPAQLLRVGLYKQENNEWSGRDGTMTVILPDANANQTPNKMANGTENVAFVKNGSLFASNHHLPLVANDVLNIRVWRTTAGANYKLKINTEQFASTNLNATLEDLFTNSRTPLNLEGTAVEYPFTVTTDALSTGDRFRIVFQNAVLGTNNPTATSFSIVPNPVTGDSFQVNLGTLATGTYSYSICNAIGQEVEKGILNNVTQNTNYEVKMSNSATGIYIMKIKGNDNTVFTAKIIKK